MSLVVALVITSVCFSQNRVDRPIQIQGNLSGLFLDIAGNAITDRTVNELKVNSWMPGLSIGYHFNRFIYVGYAFYAPLDMTLKESWGLTYQALDADIVLEHQTGAIHNLETRFTPFKFGLYASIGYANVREVDYQMQLSRKTDELLIGDSSLASDLNIEWNSENLNAVALGFGYSHVSKSGFSFNIGLSVPLRFPDDENIAITPIDLSANIQPTDLVLAKQRIKDETFYGPVMIKLDVGYNFKKF
jgi:hypothetical protein